MDDIHEPIDQYKGFFKDTHARNTSDFFEELVRQSEVDEQANIVTVSELRELEAKAGGETSSYKWWKILRGTTIGVAVLATLVVFAKYWWPWTVLPVVIFAPGIIKLNQLLKELRVRLENLQSAVKNKRDEAWRQMVPLNRLYDWEITAKLLRKVMPGIELDPYFSNGRLGQLCDTFGWGGRLGDSESVVFSHSGVINGNPFVLARTLIHWMGSKTYDGTLQISWTERVRGHDGKWRTETRHETLRASIERPFPEYANRTFIIYGNEAAPDLSFSREPSSLSKLEDGFFDSWKKKRAIKKLEKMSRDVTEGKSFTVMANREFDALFGAIDRDHEVQFRLLFTPLAQQEMLKLLKDGEIGYGDDFDFIKSHMVNLVEPRHMRRTDIGGEPEKFHHYELAHARQFFNSYHNDFFRSFYFGIAPLLAIPLYQQHRSHADIYKETHARQSCHLEHEAIANYFGEHVFKHPDCVTRSILKTVAEPSADGCVF